MKVAKLVSPKKVMKRVLSGDESYLKEEIPSQFLLEEYGGSLKYSAEDFIKDLEEYDREFCK